MQPTVYSTSDRTRSPRQKINKMRIDGKFDLLELDNVWIECIRSDDYPKFCDAYIADAYIKGVKLTEDEIEALMDLEDYGEFVNIAAHNQYNEFGNFAHI